MTTNLSQLKSWWQVAKPSKKYFFISWLGMMLSYVCAIISPIFAALAITALTESDFHNAIIYLVIEFGFVTLSYLCKHLNYYNYHKLVASSYVPINEKLVDKVLHARVSSLRKVPKESIMNMLHTDALKVAGLSDSLSIALAKILRVVITIVTIFVINWEAGLIVLMVDILNFILLSRLHNRRLRYLKEINKNVDLRCQKMSEIADGRILAREMEIMTPIKKDYLDATNSYIKSEHHKTMNQSYVGNLFSILYYGAILIATILMVMLVSKGAMTLTLYLIITPYIVSGITIATDTYGVFSDIRIASVSAARIKRVLDFKDYDFAQFGETDLFQINGAIEFRDVNYVNSEDEKSVLKNASFHIKPYEVALFTGARGGGKRVVFNLLRHEIEPTSGEILIDGLNISGYTRKAHHDNFTYVNTKPYFFSGSVMKNLKMVCKDSSKIHKTCMELGISYFLAGLPKQFSTEVNTLPPSQKYLLGVARAILTGCEIIALYEAPTTFEDKDWQVLKSTIDYYTENHLRTFLVFSSSHMFDNCVTKRIEINKGEITNIKLIEKAPTPKNEDN
ncbi:MAG: ABC transporter ATP-binding protein [Clostridia bacterium]|nr:ABC transporter ATP-binding protein [Clostridia bacterium]